MRIDIELKEAIFVERLNRFMALTVLDERETLVHVANSGRLEELMRPGSRLLLAPVSTANHRKTKYDLVLIEADGVLVSVDARLPNVLVQEAIAVGSLSEFGGDRVISAEVRFLDSRLDFLLEGPRGQCYLEVKSVTLVEGGTGLFPDAPTVRGRRHVAALVEAVNQGHRAAVVFVVQRPDALHMSPNRRADPEFWFALENAVARGVEVWAYRCTVGRKSIEIVAPVPFSLA